MTSGIRFLVAGERDGASSVVVEGLPSGIGADDTTLAAELTRLRLSGEARFVAGFGHGRTTGGPVAALVEPTGSGDASSGSRPQPGSGQLPAMLKYGSTESGDLPGPGRRADLTGRAVAGLLCRALLAELEVYVVSHVTAIGPVRAPVLPRPVPEDAEVVDESPVRCFDPGAAEDMAQELKAAESDGDSPSGVFEVLGYGVPSGLGSSAQWDRRIDAAMAGAVMSVPGIRAVEMGDGTRLAAERASMGVDQIGWLENAGYVRLSNRAGGVEDGVTTGELLVVRATVVSDQTAKPLRTVDVVTKEEVVVAGEVGPSPLPRASLAAEAMVSVVLASELLRKSGGDSVDEVRHTLSTYRRLLRWA